MLEVIVVRSGWWHFAVARVRLKCCQLRWTFSVVNWSPSSVTNLSQWPSTSVYSTMGARHCVARVCQRQRSSYY